jgi:hypothetical protein
LTTDANQAAPHGSPDAIPRRVELLLHLSSAAPDGVPLRELVDTSGRSDRNAQASTMNMLLRLRKRSLIEYTPRSSNAMGRGRLYRITHAGMELLQRGADPAAPAAAAPPRSVIETGAMRGEQPTIVKSDAARTCARLPQQPCWVFGLAQHIHSLGAP